MVAGQSWERTRAPMTPERALLLARGNSLGSAGKVLAEAYGALQVDLVEARGDRQLLAGENGSMRDELERLRQVEQDARALIERHCSATGEHPVAVTELRNVVKPGSEPMLPGSFGWTPTCSICAPDGDR